ncbi:MAG: hypothetical protein PF505_04260 [Vallitaleaceae bacterium]|jgi:hypothetical protein|nr:hypothetical protein [Vallitaleaceae bacterium]
MKPTQKELTNWAITQIEKNYKDDVVLLLAMSEHAMENDCHGECYDYFIPVNDNGNNLACTFIIDGVGHDLYPRSWERIRNMVDFTDDFTSGLGEAKILYYRNEADREQFIAMQEKQKANMQDEAFMMKIALEKLDMAMDIYRTMVFEDALYKVRMAAGFIAHYLSVAVACINGTYLKRALDLETVELKKLKEIPDNFIPYYEGIVRAKSVEELKSLSYMIISTTRKFIAKNKPIVKEELTTPDFRDLAGWYEEMSLTWRRFDFHSKAGDCDKTFNDAVNLQHELSIMKEEFGLREMDLLSYFDASNLKVFGERAKELEAYVISEIESHGFSLNTYDTLEQFLAKNS